MSIRHWSTESIARSAVGDPPSRPSEIPRRLANRLSLLLDMLEELSLSWVRMLWGVVFGMFVIGAAVLLVPELLATKSTVFLVFLFVLAFANIAGPVIVRCLFAPRVWSEEGLKVVSPVPVLANLPEMSEERERVNRRKRRRDRIRLVSLAVATLTAAMFLMMVY